MKGDGEGNGRKQGCLLPLLFLSLFYYSGLTESWRCLGFLTPLTKILH
jgi:hypothetical protein